MKATNVQRKYSRKWGQSTTPDNFNIETSGNTVRIWGVKAEGQNEPTAFDKTFAIGDLVAYDSYNMVYTAPLTKVTAKTATVTKENWGRTENKRLDLYTFIWYNWDFDLLQTRAQNAAIRQTI